MIRDPNRERIRRALGAEAMAKVKGMSGTATKAANLRAFNLPVPAGATRLHVRFFDPVAHTATPEADASYAIEVTPGWLTTFAVPSAQKTANGFQIEFATPAPRGATIDWCLVR